MILLGMVLKKQLLILESSVPRFYVITLIYKHTENTFLFLEFYSFLFVCLIGFCFFCFFEGPEFSFQNRSGSPYSYMWLFRTYILGWGVKCGRGNEEAEEKVWSWGIRKHRVTHKREQKAMVAGQGVLASPVLLLSPVAQRYLPLAVGEF